MVVLEPALGLGLLLVRHAHQFVLQVLEALLESGEVVVGLDVINLIFDLVQLVADGGHVLGGARGVIVGIGLLMEQGVDHLLVLCELLVELGDQLLLLCLSARDVIQLAVNLVLEHLALLELALFQLRVDAFSLSVLVVDHVVLALASPPLVVLQTPPGSFQLGQHTLQILGLGGVGVQLSLLRS